MAVLIIAGAVAIFAVIVGGVTLLLRPRLDVRR
jgi:hypothetical protein